MRGTSTQWLVIAGVCLLGSVALALPSCSSKDDPPTGGPPHGTTTTTGVGGNGGNGGGGSGGGELPAHCSNGVLDEDESDVDCGGSCLGCDVEQICNEGPDCLSGSCIGGLCSAPSCVDTVQNGDETDVDCGGPNCPPCEPGLKCGDPDHCTSHVCLEGVCQEPTCADGQTNGNETDVDCGGNECPLPCAIGRACLAPSDCIADKCTGNMCVCPSGMEIIPASGGGAFCIDATEVTYNAYNDFWSANPVTGQQIPECEWNPDYTPEVSWPVGPSEVTLPVVGVNWCEAYAYCTWRGKRLCGKVGGGANAPADFADWELDQWYDACSAQGNYAYPYGNSFEPTTCNGAPAWPDGGTPHTTKEDAPNPTCIGGALGLLHMSGNVREWEDSCDGSAGETDNCRTRGGSYLSDANGLRCDAPDIEARSAAAVDIGFRCCI